MEGHSGESQGEIFYLVLPNNESSKCARAVVKCGVTRQTLPSFFG